MKSLHEEDLRCARIGHCIGAVSAGSAGSASSGGSAGPSASTHSH